MFLERRVGHKGHSFLGQIIISGAKTARGYHHFRPPQRLAQGCFEPLGIIPHRMYL